MNIILADHFGMCFGVRDAFAAAEAQTATGPLTILGELVHNPLVVERLRSRGAVQGRLDSLESAPTRRVLITAHGTANERRKAWLEGGFEVTDTTCPLVHRAHSRLAALVAAGYFPVVIGTAGHAEVRGLTGDFPSAVVIGSEEDFVALPLQNRYGVISQTTQPIDHVRALVDALRAARPRSEVQFCDTVCQPTKDRQNAMRKLITQADTIIVVGGHGSNNTRQLLLAALAAGRRAYQIERAEELDPAWLHGATTVGLTAGTSTLSETVAAVKTRLEDLASLTSEHLMGDHPCACAAN